MKTIIKIFCFICFLNSSIAQNQFKIGVGASYGSIDAPDDVVYIYNIHLNQEIYKRINASLRTGFIYYNGKDNSFNEIDEFRGRFINDLDLEFILIKYKKSSLTIGLGPSIWYRKDNVVTSTKIKAEAPDFIPTIIDYRKTLTKDWNIGYNVKAEINIYLGGNISLSGNMYISNFKKIGVNSFLGLNLNYWIR